MITTNYQPIEEEHVVVDTSKETSGISAEKIISHLSRMNMKNSKN